MTSAIFNAAAGLLVVASLLASAFFAVLVIIKRRREERAAAKQAVRVGGFLEELKTDAAYAAVCEYPYSASDLLGMLERYGLITGPEIDELLTDARSRIPDTGDPDEGAEGGEPYPRSNGFSRGPFKPIDLPDEIPF